jgi:hypothetical protein
MVREESEGFAALHISPGHDKKGEREGEVEEVIHDTPKLNDDLPKCELNAGPEASKKR